MQYLPFSERRPDSQYQDMLAAIRDRGIYTTTRQGFPAKTILGHTMYFDLANGFPIINDRSIRGFWPRAIDELGAFINGARTLAELEAVDVMWWGDWLTAAKTVKRGHAAGDGGPGFYGAGFATHPRSDGGTMDLFAALMEQLTLWPYDRRHHINPWVPDQTMRSRANPDSGVPIAPCHGWIDVTVLDEKVHLEMMQRSADVPKGVPSNMVQYAALTIFIAHLLGREPGQYIHHLRNAHVYQNQEEATWPMIEREPRRLATLQLNDKGLAATDVHQFSSKLFELSDYDPHPAITDIPVLT